MISGYEVLQELAHNDWQTLYRGRRSTDRRAVLLKLPRRHPPSAADLELLENESSLLRELSVAGLPRVLELVGNDGQCCLVLEDEGGMPLLVPRACGLDEFFKLALPLTTLLFELHRREIVHQNINPRSLLLQPETGALCLTDFSRATRSTAGTQPQLQPQLMRSALAYLSPEQTGRMNRTIDYRTDFYSLGVTFYELLTGCCPFQSSDSLELIHWHIAKTPVPVSEVNPEIPEPISQVVMKLLAKTAEGRYQSALGLRADLEVCAREWARHGRIAHFPLGQHDISDRFLISQKLYGRDAEVAALLRIFERVCENRAARASMMLVAGYSGIGKTALIQELYKPIVRQRGYFISGKFDQVARDIPFGALIQAFRGLMRQLLAESDEHQRVWRARLSEALGANSGVIAEVIPEIELIAGEQAPPPVLGPAESLNRFQLVFQNFVAALARAEHPLVIFLDDLQWADAATLSLLQPLLASAEIRHLLLIASYRDNEVDATHPMMRTLSAMEADGCAIDRIGLGPLQLADLALLLGDTLQSEASDIAPLAHLVLAKTVGNPFFVIQFLKALNEAGLLKFDYDLHRWAFHIEAIAATGITDNVVDLMTRKIERLSAKAQQALMLAACIGNQFDLHTLAIASEQADGAAADALREALDEGLILPAAQATTAYTFLHDRVQQAAYGLIPDDQKRPLHLRLGRLLVAECGANVPEDRLFEIVNHLNLGGDLITGAAERVRLARLNLDAGSKAKASAAFRPALNYFERGLGLLPADRWESEYELSLALLMAAAECAYLCGDFENAERDIEVLLTEARSPLEKAEAYRLRIVQSENTARFAEAVQHGRDALALFGVIFPQNEGEMRAALEDELRRIEVALGDRAISSLADLPVMKDAETKSVVELLTAMWASAYIAEGVVFYSLLSARMVSLSLAHGNTEESAFAYVTHAMTIGSGRGDYRSGYEFGRLALAVNDQLNDLRNRAKVHHLFGGFVNFWRQPLAISAAHVREAYRCGIETGDLVYASYGLFQESWYALLSGMKLGRFEQEYAPSIAFFKRIKNDVYGDAQQVFLCWGRNLRGLTAGKLSLADESFDEEAYDRRYELAPMFLVFSSIARLHIAFTFEEYETARVTARRVAELLCTFNGSIFDAVQPFYQGLTLAALCPATPEDEPEKEKAALLQECSTLVETMKMRAENAPENFRHQYLLLAAERARITGAVAGAMDLYEEAICAAEAAGFVNDEALAYELYAKFWMRRDVERFARPLLHAARTRYQRWGATGKVRDLENRYAEILGHSEETAAPRSGVGIVTLDVATAMKAAHAIAEEIVLDELLRKLLRIAIENAGAQRGLFLQEKNGRMVIEAEASLNSDGIAVLQSIPMEEHARLAQTVIHYSRKTGESVIIADAAVDEQFADDSYIAAVKPRSILCVPVLHQGKFSGLIYLENNLAADAFTADRVEMMHVLSSQAAISLENARLYDEMKQEVSLRRKAEEDLRAALAEVETLKNRLHAENVYLREEIRREHNFEEIVGSSPALMEMLRKIEMVAATDSTVLICGETGTGKELIARAIHNRSTRKNRPLVKVNCSAISAGLVESELFGHVKGAFTGAIDRRVGRFELADGGTLFLDEIGELPPETQVKLLRVLQEEEFEPVGSNRTVRVDVRIIAATNRDLEHEIRAGRFRSDLFYRLNVFPLDAPPLRARASDVPQLVMFFLSGFAKKFGRQVEAVSQETMDLLTSYLWPGNIRELQNIIERGVVLSQGSVLELGRELLLPPKPDSQQVAGTILTPSPRPAIPGVEPLRHSTTSVFGTLEEMERNHILAILEQTGWVISGPKGAAKILNLNPNTLRSRMEKLGIKRTAHEKS